MTTETLDALIGAELGCKAKMVRFYAIRMIHELARGKHLTNAEQRKIFNKSSRKNTEKVFKNE